MRFECFNYRVSSYVKFTGADLVALQVQRHRRKEVAHA